MNMIISSFGKALKSVISIAIRLAYYVVSFKKSKSQSGLYQRQKFSALNGHQSVQGWTESLPLSFGVSSKTIKVVTEPQEMYNMMMDLTKKAKQRIVLTSLYLGNGKLESDLVQQLNAAMETSSVLRVHVLLDHCRGSRGKNNSRTMLLPSLTNHQKQMTLSLFHSPNLRGLLKTLLPPKFNEILGLQHMKFYIFDNTLVLSGANLNNDYFTNRQDRCMVIKDCVELCDYFTELADVISSFSYQINEKNEERLNSQCSGDPSKNSGVKKFCEYARTQMENFLQKHSYSKLCCDTPDTWIYPLIQMGSFNIEMESNEMHRFLLSTHKNDRLYLSTAYFNPSEEYIELITNKSDSEYHVLASAPEANGFYTAAPPLGYVPKAYTWYETLFLKFAQRHSQSHRITLYEYSRNDWTFHAKGLWYYPDGAQLPTMTIIGSSNYGYRSVHRDLENQLVITTTSPDLQKQLHQEQQNLYSSSQQMTLSDLSQPKRATSLLARGTANAFRSLF